MDLIYTNASRQDLGVLHDYTLDLAFGADENDFECRIPADAHCCGAGFFLYIEGTEYGGIVDGIASDTALREVTYTGRTWHGILNSKVLQPEEGSDYIVVSGEANELIREIVSWLGLGDLFAASTEDSGLVLKNYKIHRYIPAYDGICKMLSSVGGKLRLSYNGEKVILSAATVHDYSQDEEFDSDQVDFVARRNFQAVNHLICLGRGELSERTVIHLYADADGNISHDQSFFNQHEYAAVYDFSNVESDEELEKYGRERLAALRKAADMSVNFDAEADSYDVGDIVGAIDHVTGISAASEITKKIVTITSGHTNIFYKVGD